MPATSAAIFLTPLNFQHAVPLVGVERDDDEARAIGVALDGNLVEPLSLAETTRLIAWPLASANTGGASATTATARILRIVLLSSVDAGRGSAGSAFDRENLAVLNLSARQPSSAASDSSNRPFAGNSIWQG